MIHFGHGIFSPLDIATIEHTLTRLEISPAYVKGWTLILSKSLKFVGKLIETLILNDPKIGMGVLLI